MSRSTRPDVSPTETLTLNVDDYPVRYENRKPDMSEQREVDFLG